MKRQLDLDLQVACGDDTHLPDKTSLHGWLSSALDAAGVDAGRSVELGLRVVDAAEGQALNARYRDRDYATNVLSFPAGELPALPPEAPLPLGDLVICAEVVAREAAEQGKPARDHWAHLCVHGLLHLLGYDHETDAEAEAMEQLEIRILAGLGIADPYTTGPSG